MLNWIYNKLVQRLNKKKHEVIRLQWQKAELEQKIKKIRESKDYDEY